MAITTLNLRAFNRSDTASSGQLVTATSATAMDFQDAAAGGKVLQVVAGTKTDTTTTTSTSWADMGFSQAITPSTTGSKILVLFNLSWGNSDGAGFIKIQRDIASGGYADIAVGDSHGDRNRAAFGVNRADWYESSLSNLDSPSYSSGNAITYKIQWRSESGNTIYLNQRWSATDNASHSVNYTGITLIEIGS
jgi:hypothetical protein